MLLILVLCLVGGCAQMSMQKRSYDVSVRNDSSQPITIWLTKDGPAWEPGWKSPEDLAIENLTIDERIGGVVVQPGKTADTGKLAGSFAPETNAILRVYQGQRTFMQLLAMSPGASNRIDTILSPGTNVLRIVDNGPGIKVSK